MLNEEQKAEVAKWFAAGASLDEIQKRMKAEFGVHMTYLDLRLMVADLPQPVEAPPAEDVPPAAPARNDSDGADPTRDGSARNVPAPPRRVASDSNAPDSETSDNGPAPGSVPAPDGVPPAADLTVEVDALTIPGTFASGAVTFSDGTKAKWYLDQQGRLGLADAPQGYRPSPGDAALFQARLVEALRRRGLA